MPQKKKIMMLLGTLLFLLFLNQCTTVNIAPPTIFKKKEFGNYNYLKDGIKSDYFQIEKISEYTHSKVTYDTIHNFFIISDRSKIQKINAKGEKVIEISRVNHMDFTTYGHYIFMDTIVYDLSKKIIQQEKFEEIILPSKEITPKDWLLQFQELYQQASVVYYGRNDYKHKAKPVYFKVHENWKVLYLSGGHSFSNDDLTDYTFKNYPAKFNRLIVLKDNANKVYSNGQFSAGASVASYKRMNFEEKNFIYPEQRKIKSLFFQKEMVYEEIAYTSIPVVLGGTAYFNLKKGNDILKFKENATMSSFSFYKIKNYLSHYFIPEKFKNQSNVSFLKLKYPSNNNESGSKGWYVIKRI